MSTGGNELFLVDLESETMPAKSVAVLDYIFLILAVVLTGSIWTRVGPFYDYLGYIKIVSLIPLCLSILLRVVNKKYLSSCIVWLVLYALTSLTSLINYFDLADNVVLFAPMMLSLLLFCTMSSWREVMSYFRKYVNILVVLAAISLFFFFLGSVLKVIPPTGQIQFSWDWQRECPSYFFLYFEPQTIDIFGYAGARNCGIFSEAPMYAYLLVAAILCEMMADKKRPTVITVLVLATLTTCSTTAIVSMVIVCAWTAVAHRYHSERVNKYKKYIAAACALLAGAAISVLVIDKSATGSFGVRLDHLIGCGRAFLQSFPFGCGVGGGEESIFPLLRYKQGLSVGLPYYLAQTGILGILTYVLPAAISLFLFLRSREWNNALFVVVYTWMYFMTNLDSNSMLTWVFINAVIVYGSYRIISKPRNARDNIIEMVKSRFSK